HRDIFRLFASDVFGQLQQDGTWPLFHGDAEGVANDCRDTACAHDLERKLCKRLESANHVHDVKFRLAAAHDAFLPCEHDHRHAAKQSIGCPCRQVQGAWTEGGDTD